MSLNPDIVPLLSCPRVEVSRLVLGSDISVQWVCFAHFAGCIGVEFPLGLHLVSPILGYLCLRVMKQGFYI